MATVRRLYFALSLMAITGELLEQRMCSLVWVQTVYTYVYIYTVCILNIVCKAKRTEMMTVRKFGVVRGQGGQKHPTYNKM